jgi:hypothetical protein
LQVPFTRSVRYYNAAMIASAATVAVAANSPFLFGRSLWEETRIPVFEQAVDVGGTFERVTFGTDYVHDSLEELFLENRICHPVLLPSVLDAPSERVPHVRLHNGTIYRWNRALIGFDLDGQPHLRLEHRPMAAGPTLIDSMADLAFSVGLIASLANREPSPESIVPFAQARSNFYSAARHGLDAHIRWLDGWEHLLGKLVEAELVPAARAGLASFGIDAADADSYLDVIRARVSCGQTGARWQREFVKRNGPDMCALVRRYHTLQNSGKPVHEWPLS